MSEFTPCPAGCVYEGSAGALTCCNYLLLTDKMRGCEGGAHCAKYEPVGFSVDKARRLYDQGITDREIAAEMGASYSTVHRWRLAAQLPPKSAKHKRRCKFDETLARKLYDDGLSDQKIADQVGASFQSISRWRIRNGLPSNYIAKGVKRCRV